MKYESEEIGEIMEAMRGEEILICLDTIGWRLDIIGIIRHELDIIWKGMDMIVMSHEFDFKELIW